MKPTDIEGLLVVTPRVFTDDRGYFFESYNQQRLVEYGLDHDFVQDNESRSQRGVVRGLHFQIGDAAQTKLVRVVSGRIFDVAVDLRENSLTYGKWFGLELSGENKRQLLIPRGFAHGFSALTDRVIVAYKCDNYYDPTAERGIRFDDPDLNIDWQLDKTRPIVAERDLAFPSFNSKRWRA